MEIETVKVKHESELGYMLVNKDVFEAGGYELFESDEQKEPEVKPAQRKTKPR